MPVIYNKKVEYAYTDPGVKAHTLSWAEYQALSEDDKMNGDLYFIPDKQPEGNPSRIWTKLGTDPLTTQADDVSGAVNELNSSLGAIGNYYTTDWLATSSSSNNNPLTYKMSLPKGSYILYGIAPTCSTSIFGSFNSSKHIVIRANTFVNISTLALFATNIVVNEDSTEVWLQTASSTSITFSNIERGYLRAIKIK